MLELDWDRPFDINMWLESYIDLGLMNLLTEVFVVCAVFDYVQSLNLHVYS